MRTTKQEARFAGRLYFLLALVAPLGLLYVPGKIFVAGGGVEAGHSESDVVEIFSR